MIERIQISGCTPYSDTAAVMDGLRVVNFIYGANGAGKTTLSRLIADASPFSKCVVTWRNNHKLQPMVYNRDFVRDNFSETGKLKGIFTLGKQDIAVRNQIAQAKSESNEYLSQIDQLKKTLDGPHGETGRRGALAAIEESFRDECWKLKVKHNAKLRHALRGFLNDKKAFKDRLLKECEKPTNRTLLTQAELEEKALSLYGETPTAVALLPILEDAAFLEWEAAPVLSRRIIGKSDVDIAALIQKLGSSDWVKQGVPFLTSSDGLCPFCQQTVPDQLSSRLEEYFDETYLSDTASLNSVHAGYRLEGERLRQTMQQFAGVSPRFLDADKLSAEQGVFEARFALNLQRLAGKVKEPTLIVALEPLGSVLQTIHVLIRAANDKIKKHNNMVDRLGAERNRLSEDVWAFLAHAEIASAYESYCNDKSGVQKAIDKLSEQISKAQEGREERERTIQRLERTVTSVQPTVNEINRLLHGFGFLGFSLEALKGNLYRLCRRDGSDAQETLSEGERGFVTFLYFFHLLRGSTSEAGVNADRVVVFDDPVSSLDSDVLFVVSTLIKQTIEEVRAQSGNLKQVFVLTHNVYFFKEVLFDSKRSNGMPQSHEAFWTIRKVNGISSVQRHTSNPIKTSYDLLWEPLRQPNCADQALQNNMRRILEHYFRILGGVSEEKILSQFDGEEKLICRSLLSWVNDGSHSIPDDVFYTLDESAMQRYLAVFQRIFIKMNHANHYNMMMGPPHVIISEV